MLQVHRIPVVAFLSFPITGGAHVFLGLTGRAEAHLHGKRSSKAIFSRDDPQAERDRMPPRIPLKDRRGNSLPSALRKAFAQASS